MKARASSPATATVAAGCGLPLVVVCLKSAPAAERMDFPIHGSKSRNSFAQKLCRARMITHFTEQNA